ncbi:MAG: alpha/beta fold hydrolase [Flavobacteriaceae bacterium]|nr:alpha/beta fold hydrolase [Flavobacteriaceae bacterium]
MQILNSKIIGDSQQHLIIVHGLFGQLDNWNTLGKKFQENFTTHLIDLRNHGRSFHDDDTSQQAMVADLENYLNHHQISSAHFIGHSLGGKVVMLLALKQPEKVDKLIVADMAPKDYPPHHQDIIQGLENVDFSQVNVRNDVEEFMIPYIPHPTVRQFLLKNVYRKPDETYAFRFNLKVLSENYIGLVTNQLPDKTFDKPVLFLAGEKSDYIMAEDKELILKYFPHAKIEYISDAGHWLHAEKPIEFLEKSLKFLL